MTAGIVVAESRVAILSLKLELSLVIDLAPCKGVRSDVRTLWDVNLARFNSLVVDM